MKMEFVVHVTDTGVTKMLCVLALHSRMIDCIRKDFGLKAKTKYYDMHVTLVEKIV